MSCTGGQMCYFNRVRMNLSHTLDKKVLCKLRTDVKCSVHSYPIKNKASNVFVGLVACGNKSINFLKSLPKI